VARRHRARRGRGGGDGIQAARPSRARLATGGAALVVALGLAAAPALRAERLVGLLACAGGLGVLFLVYALVRGRASVVPWSLVALGGAYAGSLFLPERGIDREAPLVAAAFVLLAELAYWTLELGTPIEPEPGMLGRRVGVVAAATLGALVVAAAVTVAATVQVGGGVPADLLGVAAAVGALAIVTWLAQRQRAAP
jgi:ABC-type Fe3+-siderophore transport system permease subunit